MLHLKMYILELHNNISQVMIYPLYACIINAIQA